jgi:hypothetical protein
MRFGASTLALALLAAVATTCAGALPLLDEHVLLKRREADLAEREARVHAQEEAAARAAPTLRAAVLGSAKPAKKATVEGALGKYAAAKRMAWIASKNRSYAHKLVQRLTPRLPKLQAAMKDMFTNYIKGELSVTALNKLKTKVWYAGKMETVSKELAAKLDTRAKALTAKGPGKVPAARINTLRARAAAYRNRATSYGKAKQTLAMEAREARARTIDWCKLGKKAACNVALRDYLVSRHRLWEATRNRTEAKKEAKRYDTVADGLRETITTDTFVDYTTGMRAFRKLREAWMREWRFHRMCTIIGQMQQRTKRRADRVWASMNSDTISKQEQAAAEARSKGETLPASGADKIASDKVVYQTTIGKRAPAARTRPEVQFAGPNMDPQALAGAEVVSADNNNN